MPKPKPAPSTIHPSAKIHPMTNVYDSHIGEHTRVAAFVEIGGASIGRCCSIQAFAFICPGVTLQDSVFIGPHACFTNDKYPKAFNPDFKPLRTLVKPHASIGAGCIILPGVTIGTMAMIGAGTIVTRDVPDRIVIRGGTW